MSDKKKKKPGELDDDLIAPLEPVFTLDLDAPIESSFSEEGPVQQQLSELQPQVDVISSLDQSEPVSSNQMEVLRKYIALKEKESQDLKEQNKQYQSYVRRLTVEVSSLTQRVQRLVTDLQTSQSDFEAIQKTLRQEQKQHQEGLIRLKNEYEDQLRRSGNVSAEFEELQRRREQWKDKVRDDLKRIKLKERELENKYELLKRDTQALLDSKDSHVMELKRKNDALELEMEALEERLREATMSLSAIQAKKRRLIETLRLAGSLLETLDQVDPPQDTAKKAG